ncbi:MAG: low molecular weight protein-tyrosine-phosphatase [Pseudomonadota bacterium]
MPSVLFVCLGNICRSPMAEGIFRHLVAEAGLDDTLKIDSAGNSAMHEGEAPNPRAISVMREHGIDITGQRSRPLTSQDFDDFDLILCMDEGNIKRLDRVEPENHNATVDLFLNHVNGTREDVPDPYYGHISDYNATYARLYPALQALLEKLR